MKEETMAEQDELSPDSIRQIEASVTAHRRAVELAEQRRVRVEALEHELKLTNLELDKLRLDHRDLNVKYREAERTAREALSARVAYETLTVTLARILTEFTPPTPMVNAHRQNGPGLNVQLMGVRAGREGQLTATPTDPRAGGGEATETPSPGQDGAVETPTDPGRRVPRHTPGT